MISGTRLDAAASCALSSNPAHNGRGGMISGTRLDAAASCALPCLHAES
jgi:hypothetical protein